MIVVCPLKADVDEPGGAHLSICSICWENIWVNDRTVHTRLVCTACWPSMLGKTAVSNALRQHYLHHHGWTDEMIEVSLDRQTRRLKAVWN